MKLLMDIIFQGRSLQNEIFWRLLYKKVFPRMWHRKIVEDVPRGVIISSVTSRFLKFLIANTEARKVRGPTLLKDIWKLPPGKTLDVLFNKCNQSIGKEGRKLPRFLGIVARTHTI